MAKADFSRRDFSRADRLAYDFFNFAALHRQTAAAACGRFHHVAYAGIA